MAVEIREGWRLGQLLRNARIKAGYSFARAAEVAGIAKQTWHNLETGWKQDREGKHAHTPSDEIVRRAARAVGLDPEECVNLANRQAPRRSVDHVYRGSRSPDLTPVDVDPPPAEGAATPSAGLVQRLTGLVWHLDDDDLDAIIHLAERCIAARRGES